MNKYLIIIIICLNCLSAQVTGNAKTKLQSLLLPGWGQNSLGESKRATNYFIREAALWLIFVGSKKSADWYESDYTAFAELHANVDMTGKEPLFAVNMGHYDSLDDYNDTKERQRLVNDKYEENKNFDWQWDNSTNRIKFDNMRIKSVTLDKYAKFSIGGLILHRMVSFFDMIYLERINSRISIEPQLSPDSNSMSINFTLKL
ncbi:MAG: hypothetical protein QF856_07870 [Candidatus Marinimicrobia bacterium]|nr:hypothetical protein [Candidatus Neomarinimicrobiota bacterium]